MDAKKSLLQLQLLKELLEGKVVSTKSYSLKSGVNQRTIQRYMEDISEIFSENIIKNGTNYKFISDTFLEKDLLTFDKKELEILVDLFSLVEFDFTNKFDENSKAFLEKIRKKYSNVYNIKQNPFENIFEKKELLSDIKNGIKNRKYVNIKYSDGEDFLFDNTKIFKIVFTEGNFYLAVLINNETNDDFKFLRLSFVTQIELLQTTFNKDLKALDFLKNFQTIFSSYDKKPYDIMLQIDRSIKKNFLNKKILPSQTIIRDDEDLIVSYKITNDMEILPIVKQWIPHIKIIFPHTTKQKLNNELVEYLKINA